MPIRLRIWAGIYEPAWLKAKLGTVGIEGSQSGDRATMVPYWNKSIRKQYWAYYERLQNAIKNHTGESNPLIKGVQISGTMFVYSEPFLHQFGAKYTIKHVLKSGWTVKKDKKAQLNCLKIHQKVWQSVPQMFAFNAYQYLAPDHSVRMDPKYVNKFIGVLRSKFGKKAIIANHSIREEFIGQDKHKNNLYHYLKKAGRPLYFQTATWDRISVKGTRATNKERHAALIRVMNWALKMGAMALEVPDGHNLTDAEIASYNSKFIHNRH